MRIIGQVRYEWLHLVGFRRKASMLTFEGLSLTYQDGESFYNTYLVFPKGTDTEFLANAVVKSACKYRLAMKDAKSEDDIEFFRKYSETGRIEPKAETRELSSIILPHCYRAPFGEEFRPDQ